MARKIDINHSRSLKKIDLFICDGNNEKWYLELLKPLYPHKKFDVKPELSKRRLEDVIKLIDELCKDYENIFWIVDFDVIIKEDAEKRKGSRSKIEIFNSAYVRLSKKPNVHIYVNNPCLEYWILLHFRFTLIPSTNCSDILPQLEKIDVLEGYSKSERYYKNQRINLVGRINESLPTAIKNAKRLGDFDIYNPYNPVVEIYKLFEGYF